LPLSPTREPLNKQVGIPEVQTRESSEPRRERTLHNILIEGGTVVDGTGSLGKPLDVAIDGAKIAQLCKRSEAKGAMRIDARGLIVCPGFIDIHSHSEFHLLANPLAESKIRQGVTTELVGNCGSSPAPAIGVAKEALQGYAELADVRVDWVTMDEYLLRLSNLKTSVNVATLVGASTLRQCVIGNSDTKAGEDELAGMNRLLADAMLQGGIGLSSGLIYVPGCYASTEELVSLASTSASLGGFYASHIRGEGRTLIKAVEEAIRIGREGHSRVEISHHKACGRPSWGAVNRTIAMIEEAREQGVDVSFDVYPYTASCTALDTLLQPWAREGSDEDIIARIKDPQTRKRIIHEFVTPTESMEDIVTDTGWDNINVVGLMSDVYRRFDNKTVAEIAEAMGKDPDETTLDILVEENLRAYAIFHEMVEDDVIRVICHPLAAIGSDGEAEAPYGPSGKHATHPRAYGTFPRALRRYAIDKKLVPMEELIRRMTSWPAQRIGLQDRGVLASGMAADIVAFDPEKIRDLATFENSHRYAEGIVYVVVNGAVTIDHGEHTKERAGQVLRHKPGIA
jgi:N-acyl-D-amino-acid deacylase